MSRGSRFSSALDKIKSTKGFDFLGYHLRPEGLEIGSAKVRFAEYALRLSSESKARAIVWPCLVGMCIDGDAARVRDAATFVIGRPLLGTTCDYTGRYSMVTPRRVGLFRRLGAATAFCIPDSRQYMSILRMVSRWGSVRSGVLESLSRDHLLQS